MHTLFFTALICFSFNLGFMVWLIPNGAPPEAAPLCPAPLGWPKPYQNHIKTINKFDFDMILIWLPKLMRSAWHRQHRLTQVTCKLAAWRLLSCHPSGSRQQHRHEGVLFGKPPCWHDGGISVGCLTVPSGHLKLEIYHKIAFENSRIGQSFLKCHLSLESLMTPNFLQLHWISQLINLRHLLADIFIMLLVSAY